MLLYLSYICGLFYLGVAEHELALRNVHQNG